MGWHIWSIEVLLLPQNFQPCDNVRSYLVHEQNPGLFRDREYFAIGIFRDREYLLVHNKDTIQKLEG